MDENVKLHPFPFLFAGAKYETLTVVSGYKVYMKLRIRNVDRIDFMQYKCVAKNALGASDGSITLYGKKLQLIISSLVHEMVGR